MAVDDETLLRKGYTIILMPGPTDVLENPTDSSLTPEMEGEYSTWMTAIGWTTCTLRRVEGKISESAIYWSFQCYSVDQGPSL